MSNLWEKHVKEAWLPVHFGDQAGECGAAKRHGVHFNLLDVDRIGVTFSGRLNTRAAAFIVLSAACLNEVIRTKNTQRDRLKQRMELVK